MKKNNLIAGILFVVAGAVILAIALLTDSKLDSLLFGFGGAAITPGFVMICKFLYWTTPENKGVYEERLAAERIEMQDELKVKLRDRSGRYAYLLGLLVVCISIVIFSVLGALELIGSSHLIVLYLGGYLAFQIAVGMVIFYQLLRKY